MFVVVGASKENGLQRTGHLDGHEQSQLVLYGSCEPGRIRSVQTAIMYYAR